MSQTDSRDIIDNIMKKDILKPEKMDIMRDLMKNLLEVELKIEAKQREIMEIYRDEYKRTKGRQMAVKKMSTKVKRVKTEKDFITALQQFVYEIGQNKSRIKEGENAPGNEAEIGSGEGLGS